MEHRLSTPSAIRCIGYGAIALFAGPAAAQAASADAEARQAELFEQIGRLKMELEWLKKKVARFG